MKIRIVKKKIIDELSFAGAEGGRGIEGHVDSRDKKELEEMFSTSGAIMGSGSGRGPYRRSPKGHKRYVRMRFIRQGLQNFKPSRYFRNSEQQLGEKWSREERKKRKNKCSNPKGFTMKQFCKNQRTRSKKGQKNN